MAEAKAGQRAVLFVDAVHVVFAPFLGFLWCFSRFFVKAPSGRSRFNVLGAINAISHELITVTNESYINAQSVCELLWKMYHANLGIPITLILDNARYQKCALVIDLAKSLNIELLYLPPYSPNLNLILDCCDLGWSIRIRREPYPAAWQITAQRHGRLLYRGITAHGRTAKAVEAARALVADRRPQ